LKNNSQILQESTQQAIQKMNDLGRQGKPFLFVIDYEMKQPVVLTLEEVETENIFYKINDKTNFEWNAGRVKPPVELPACVEFELEKYPISFQEYKQSFDIVKQAMLRGDSFLTNLTKPTPIKVNLSLQEIFQRSRAKYQLYFKDKFVLFSPEIFIKIQDGIISSHPMKGTISADIPDAERVILNDKKEFAEHTTIVDLIRNDISMVAEKVWVEKFRYLSRVHTHEGDLIQVSSEICGQLPDGYAINIGTLLIKLLPAGSITGAPKPQTLAIIKEAENYDRGYYTGVFGLFDGENLDSSVMIRFIEKQKDGSLIFKSGGGITVFSDPRAEYQEMIDKVYLPI
jgi:para-aminobenzoate synthetase component I